MANISVRIPDEVRTYKEKVMFGLTARQLICSVAILGICVPLYYFGSKYWGIADDTLSWAIILIALPLAGIGFVNIQGLPMEKYAVAWFKFEWLYPRKRKYEIENVYRDLQNRAIKEEQPKSSKERKQLAKVRAMELEERNFLVLEAEENGYDYEHPQRNDYDPYAEELLTVRKGGSAGGGKKNNKDSMNIST